MNLLKKHFSLKKLMKHLKSEGRAMQTRFVFYIASSVTALVALLLLLLNLFGILNPTNNQVMDLLDFNLQTFTDNIEHDYDKVAAHAISYSENLEYAIQKYLTENNLSFDELENNATALTELQNTLYDTVYLNMQLAPASGAFYILDTTINSNSKKPLYNGIYLKYVNLYSENTVNNEFTLYRGTYSTGKNNNINFHSAWQNEMHTSFFEDCESIFSKDVLYVLSTTVEIPDTWERARYVYVPIHGIAGNIIGVCGFEISDLYFQLMQKNSDKETNHLVSALLDHKGNEYSGQFNSNHYNNSFVINKKKGYSVFNYGTEICIGITEDIKLGNNTFTVAVMLTQAQYENYIKNGQIQFATVLIIVILFAFALCTFMTKKYMSPILKKINQITAKDEFALELNISEINDLFAFLEERDNYYESKLKLLEKEKYTAEEEAKKSRNAYKKAVDEYELALSEIQYLAGESKKEIALEDYEYFICNLSTLTPTEHKIYELYLSGKNAKQIAQLLNITENTLKFHNKNIYSKLGISSRKQLLRFATLKQHQDKKK